MNTDSIIGAQFSEFAEQSSEARRLKEFTWTKVMKWSCPCGWFGYVTDFNPESKAALEEEHKDCPKNILLRSL